MKTTLSQTNQVSTSRASSDKVFEVSNDEYFTLKIDCGDSIITLNHTFIDTLRQDITAGNIWQQPEIILKALSCFYEVKPSEYGKRYRCDSEKFKKLW